MMSSSPLSASSESTSSIYYRGAWTPAEHDAMEAVVRQAEAAHPPWNPALGKPWVCLCIAVGPTNVYLAHRMGGARVFNARSAQELADQIARQHSHADQEMVVA